jgi:hypothetical protein
MEYIVQFNTANAIAKMPKKRRNWERQLIDNFIRTINGKRYACGDYDALRERLEFIAGHSSPPEMLADPENFVAALDSEGQKKTMPVMMYGIAQGYINIEKALEPLKGRALVIIPFSSFYDMRQADLFKGCYIEVLLAGESTDAKEAIPNNFQ